MEPLVKFLKFVNLHQGESGPTSNRKLEAEDTVLLYENQYAKQYETNPLYQQNERFWQIRLHPEETQKRKDLIELAARKLGPALGKLGIGMSLVHSVGQPNWLLISVSSHAISTADATKIILEKWEHRELP